MQEDNIIEVIPLTDVVEFTIQKKAMTQEELNIIHSYGFFLTEYFTQNNCMYYTFRRGIMDKFEINPGIILSKLDLKEDDTILITIDLDKYDLDEAHDIFKLIANSFPHNNIVTTFKGIEISAGAGSSPK